MNPLISTLVPGNTNTVVGKLSDVKVSGSNVILTLTDDNLNTNTVSISQSLFSEQLHNTGSIDQASLDTFYKGTTGLQANNIKNFIIQSGLIFRIELDPTQTKSIKPGLPNTLIGKSIQPQTNLMAPTTTVKNNNAPQPASWGEQTKKPPFTPVKVPFHPEEGVRIGYAKFTNPITHVSQTRQSYVDELPTLRQAGSIKRGEGYSYQSYTISYVAHGPAEIQKSVKEVLEQIHLTPFITVEGGPFGTLQEVGDIPYHDIAVRNYSISTVDGLPNTLQVQITFDPFMWEFYCPPVLPNSDGQYGRWKFDDMLCWPLIKMWAKTRNMSRYNNLPFNGRMVLSFPNEDTGDFLNALLQQNQTYNPVNDDINTLTALKNGAIGQNSNQNTQKNVKVISGIQNRPYGTDYYAVKLSDQSTWNQFVSEEFQGVSGISDPAFDGLISWNLLSSFNFANSDGQYIPSSTSVNIGNLQGNPDYIGSTDADGLVIYNIVKPTGSSGSIKDQIQVYILKTFGLNSVPVSGDTNYNLYITKILPLIQNQQAAPWKYYAIVLKTRNPDEKASLKRRIGHQISSLNNKASYQYTSLQTKLRQGFKADNSSIYTFSTGQDDDIANNNILVERIAANKAHNLALTSTSHNPLPLHSFMGGVDSSFIVQGKCFGIEAKRVLEQLKETWEKRTLFKQNRKFLSDRNDVKKGQEYAKAFLKVDNELFQLMGVDFVMPISLDIESIDGQPEVWDFSLSLIEYDPRILKSEEIKFLPTLNNNLGKILDYSNFFGTQGQGSPIIDKGLDYLSLQSHLLEEEVYPDMQLPSVQELTAWINCIVKLAKLWNSNPQYNSNSFSVSSLPTNGSNFFLKSEKELLQIAGVQEFMAHNNEQISTTWTVPDNNSQLGNGSAYVDPDFYCYYDHEQSWGSVFKLIGDQLLGDRNGLHAKGNTGTDSIPQPGQRIYDPDNRGHVTVHDSNSWAVDDGTGSNITAQQNSNLIKNTYPKDRLQDTLTVRTQIEQAFDSQSGKWWDDSNGFDIVSKTDPNNASMLLITPQDLSHYYDQNLPSTVYNPQDGPGSPDDIDVVGNRDANDGQNPEQYFSLQWRQNITLSAAGQGAQIGVRKSNYDTNAGVFLLPNPVTNLQTQMTNGSRPGIKDVQTYASDLILYELKGGDSFQSDPMYSFTFNFNTPFLALTAISNSNLKYYSGVTSQSALSDSSFGGSDLDACIKNSEPYILWVGAEYKVDPNIIRAFFARRNGLGQSTQSAGIFSLDPSAFPPNTIDPSMSNDEKAHQAILLFGKLYAKYAAYFAYPSVVLTAIEMTVNSDLRAKYYDESSNDINEITYNNLIDVDLKDVFNTTGAQTLTNDLSQFSDATNLLNQYQTAYIEICRNYGVFNIDNFVYDSYFYNLSPYILLDVGNNIDKTVAVTGPTGISNTLDLNRTATNAMPYELRKYANLSDPSSIDFMQLQKTATKLKAAMNPSSEGAIYGSLVDLRKHSNFGRLVGAYPSFQIIIINEGFYWQAGGRKLWDQYYTRTGVAEIEIFRSRMIPGSTCSITFSNAFQNLSAYALREVVAQELAVSNNNRIRDLFSSGPIDFIPKTVAELFNNVLAKKVPDDLIKLWKNNQMKAIALQVGARIQVRMGYGSNSASLPIIFNGTVSEVPITDGYMTVYAVGDGYELQKPCTKGLVKGTNSNMFSDGGFLGIGKDPSSIVTESIVGASLWDNIMGGTFRDLSNGVSHFGETYFEDALHKPAEVQINIYSSSSTILEQGIPSIRNYFNTAALYNWSDSNLISVSVDEPTPWKVMEVCRHACLDFVTSAEPFAMVSSAFFGKWWWPLNYTYSSDILNAKNPFTPISSNTLPTKNVSLNALGTKEPSQYKVAGRPISSLAGKPMKDNEVPPAVASLIGNRKTTDKFQGPVIVTYLQNLGDNRSKFRVYYGDQFAYDVQDEGDGITPPSIIDPQTIPDAAQDYPTIQNASQFVQQVQEQIFIPNPSRASLDTFDPLTDVNKLVSYLEWKNYMQCYIAHSGINLLMNNIVADKEKVYTDAYGTRKETNVFGGESLLKTIQFSIDSNIEPGDRKTIEVDTNLQVTAVQKGGKLIQEAVANLVPYLGDVVSETPTTPAVENGVVSVLIDSVKDMYQGEFVIFGTPTIKPRDLILLTDHKNNMKGPVFVKEVVHKMNAQEGFISIIRPDCVVLPHSSAIGHALITSMCQGMLHRLGAFLIYRTMLATTWGVLKNKYATKNVLETIDNVDKFNRILGLAEDKDYALKQSKDYLKKEVEQKYEALLKKPDAPQLDTPLYEKLLSNQRSELTQIETANSLPILQVTSTDLGYGKLPDKVYKANSDKFLQKIIQYNEQIVEQEALNIRNIRRGKISIPGTTREDMIRAAKRQTDQKRKSFIDNNTEPVSEILNSSNIDARLNNLIDETQDLINLKKYLPEMGGVYEVSGQFFTNPAEYTKFIDQEIADKTKSIQELTNQLDVSIKDIDELQRYISDLHLFSFTNKKSVGNIANNALNNFGKTVYNDTIGPYIDGTKALFSDKEAISQLPGTKLNAWAKMQNLKDQVDQFVEGGIGSARRLKEYKNGTTVIEDGRSVYLGVKEGVEAARLLRARRIAFLKLGRLYEYIRDIYTGARLVKYMGPQAIISFAVDTAQFIIGGSLIDGLNARFKARQVAKIYPLMIGDIPYVAGIRGHQGVCFPPETPILMGDLTEKPISEIKPGDTVISHLGIPKLVTGAFLRRYEGPLINIRPLRNGTILRCTPEHPIYSQTKLSSGFDWNMAAQLAPADLITEPLTNLVVNDLDVIDTKKYFDEAGIETKIEGDRIIVPGISNKAKNSIPRFIKLNKNFLQLIGYYLAEGDTNINQGYRVGFTFHSNERQFHKDVTDALDELDVPYAIFDKRLTKTKSNCINIRARSKTLSILFKILCDSLAWNKKLHPIFMSLPPEKQLHIYNCWVRGDGCYRKYCTTTCSTSYILIRQMYIIASRLGKKVSLQKRETRGKMRKPCWILEESDNVNTGYALRIENNMSIKTIKKITEEEYTGFVYNIEVEDDHSYVANFIAVHNCIGDEPSWTDNLLSNWLQPQNTQWNSVNNLTGWLAALAGIEVPEYGITENDNKFLTWLQSQDSENG